MNIFDFVVSNSKKLSQKHTSICDSIILETEEFIYHVTTTANAKKIKAQGIKLLQPTNWVKAGDKSRYGGGEIYAFEKLHDAVKWAAKMDWAQNQEMGSGKITILKLKKVGEWEVDTNDPLGQMGSKGNWLKMLGKVAPENIVGEIPFTNDLVKKLVKDEEITEMATDVETEIANKTSRTSGAVGARAIVPKKVAEIARRKDVILDFGSGKDAAHAHMLRNKGFNVTAYDFGSNVKDGIHDPQALSRQYDLVYASNVLNTQSSPAMMKETLRQIFGATKQGGRVVANFPMSPRKMPELVAAKLEQLLRRYGNVQRVGGTNQAPMWLIVKGGATESVNEEWVDEVSMFDENDIDASTPVYANPTFKELRSLPIKYGQRGRGVIDLTHKDIYVWDTELLHADVESSELASDNIDVGDHSDKVGIVVEKDFVIALDAQVEGRRKLRKLIAVAEEVNAKNSALKINVKAIERMLKRPFESVNEAEVPQYKIYIREPWATKLLDGVKTIETSTFSLPERFKDVPLYVQNENREITGIIQFSGSKKYQSAEEFEADAEKHGIGAEDSDSPYHFNNRIRTYGWIISYAEKFDVPLKGKPFHGQFRIQPALMECHLFEYNYDVKTGGSGPWPKETWVINMCSAHECPSREGGLCQLGKYGDVTKMCYAYKDEHRYKTALDYRRRQEQQWNSMSGEQLADDIIQRIEAARVKPTLIRFSEAGDFRSQADVDKMFTIATKLQPYGVKLSGYTARKDLDFSKAPENMIINGSDFTAPGIANVSKAVSPEEFKNLPVGAIKCKGECGGSSKGCGTCFKKTGATTYAEVKVPKNESITEEVVEHEHSNTQIPVPHEIAEEVIAFGLSIPDEEIYTDPNDPSMGRELTPHITIKWGLVTEDPNEVESLIEDDAEQFTVTLGKVSIFSKEDKPYDVVKVDVESEELRRLHDKFSSLKNDDENPEYAPHMTIAYVTKGVGQKYLGRTDFEGKEFVVDSFDFKDQHGNSKQLILNQHTGGN